MLAQARFYSDPKVDFLMPTPSANSSQFVSPFQEKIDDLIRRMTVEEKAGQMDQISSFWEITGPAPTGGSEFEQYEQLKQGLVGSMLNVTGAEATRKVQQIVMDHSRLKIPLIIGYDVIHGYKTLFPIPLGEAASWDLDAAEMASRVAAVEASAAGIHWTFAPMMDIARDARWGRMMESSGEDPYLASLLAAARVRGFQGDDLSAPDTIAACAKHYAAYGLCEAGRDYNTVELSEQTLRNVVLPPFKAAVDAGVATVMNSFSVMNGIPATGSIYLQRDILKGEWDFQGFVVSDWASIGEMVTHGFAQDPSAAAHLAVIAGSDMDMASRCYLENLPALVRSGKVAESLLDDAVRRILHLKFKLGLFDDPYRYCDPLRERELTLCPEHLAAARDAGRKAIVLLKNEGGVLPLSKSGKVIAVIGPLAMDKDIPLGSWRAQAETNSAVSLVEGIQAALGPDHPILFAQGAALTTGPRSTLDELTFNESDRSGFPEAVKIAGEAEMVVLALGEDCWQTGEARSQSDIGLKGLQQELFAAIHAVNSNIVVILMNGRPLDLGPIAEQATAILETWFLGSQAGHAIADVLFGDYQPTGRLPVSFPRNTGQAPIYYNHHSTGRPENLSGNVYWSHYTDVANDPLYPFGFGLAYTSFEYSEITLSALEITSDERLQASVLVENTGERAGLEVVQLYRRDVSASAVRPVRELIGYQRVELRPGESRVVSFSLGVEDLKFHTPAGKWEAEPGRFQLFIGPNSRDVLQAAFELK